MSRQTRLRVKEAMAERNVSIGELAERTGLHHQTIGRLMCHPERNATIGSLAVIGEALDIPTSQLFEDVEQ